MNATKQVAPTSRRKKNAAQALTKGQPHSRDVCLPRTAENLAMSRARAG